MKILSRIVSLLSAFLGITLLVRPRSKTAYELSGFRVMAGALSPVLGITSVLNALLGVKRRDSTTALLGTVGAIAAGRYIIQSTRPHKEFDRAFGPGWERRIPAAMYSRMLKKRYSPVLAPLPEVPWQQDLVYATHVETGDPLLCDVWEPPDGVSRTGLGIIYLHGGGWHHFDKDSQTRAFFRHLAGQGHVIMDVAYTLAPKATLFPMVADVKRAIAWMKTQGADYGVDPDHIVLMGGSAGAHLSLLTVYTANDPQFQPDDVKIDTSVCAVVSYYGTADLRTGFAHIPAAFGSPDGPKGSLAKQMWDNIEEFLREERIIPPYGKYTHPYKFYPGLLGGTISEVPEMYRVASPIVHVKPTSPTTLLLQADNDVFFSPEQDARLYEALSQAGVKAVHIVYENTDHGFDLVSARLSPPAQAVTYDVERFLALMI
jgi:acetyl esterase/lipase